MPFLGLLFLLGCEIRDADFQLVRTLPGGSICEVFPDGGWIASDQAHSARYFSPDGKVLWEAAGYYNHQLRLDDEGNVLLLKNEVVDYGGEKLRTDVIEKRSRIGRLLASWSSWDHVLELGGVPVHTVSFPDLKKFFGADVEASHVNAVHVIPRSARRATHGAVYVVTEGISRACLGFSRDLKKILWSYVPPRLSKRGYTFIHDCQVDDHGSIYYFDNGAVELDSGEHDYKAFLRDQKDHILFEYPQRKEDFRVAQVHGGIQRLPAGWLISADVGTATQAATGGDSMAFAVLVDDSGSEKKRFKVAHSFQELRLVKYPKR